MASQQQIFVKAPLEQVRDALRKPEIFLKCIPGCKSARSKNDDQIEISGMVEVAFLRRELQAVVTIKNDNDKKQLTFHALAEKYAQGDMLVTLESAENGTMVSYQTSLKMITRFANLGGFIINRAARKLGDDFFKNFSKQF